MALLLSDCSDKLPWIDLSDDSLIAVTQKDTALIALGIKREYVVAGSLVVRWHDKQKKLVPGECYEIISGEVKAYVIYQLIKEYSKQFPILKSPEVIKNAAAQKVAFNPSKKPPLREGIPYVQEQRRRN